MHDRREAQAVFRRLFGEDSPLRRSETAHGEVRLRERIDILDPDDRTAFEHLARALTREVLDERRDLVRPGLLGELGDLEREVAGPEDQEWLAPAHGGGSYELPASARPSSVPPMQPQRRTRLEFQPPALGEEEVEAVAETLRSGWLGPGPKEQLLEQRVAETLGARNVVAVSSCTVAIELALLALDVGQGDEVITTPMTWPATANAIAHTGALPVFCDVRDDDLTLDAASAAELVTERTRAIVPVHLAGQPADLDAIAALGIPIVEDAAHAFGAAFRGRPIGTVGTATCFSLYVTKHVVAGEGGLVATDRDDVAERVRAMRRIGRGADGRYDQLGPALKASLPDVLASIALVQLDKLSGHDEARARQFELYDAGLADLIGIEPVGRDGRDVHARHLYIVRVDRELAGATRAEYQQGLADDLIATSIHFLPVHRLRWFSQRYPAAVPLPVAERAGEEVLSLPLSPVHSDDDIRDVVEAIRTLHARFTA